MLPIASHGNRRRRAALCACVVLFAACSSEARIPRGEVSAPLADDPDDRDANRRRCAVPRRRATPPETTPHYGMSIAVDPEAGTVTGQSEVVFPAERPTRRIVFRLWPNGPRLQAEGAELVVDDARLEGGGGVVEQPDPTTLVFQLDDALAVGEVATVHLDWRLDLPGPILDRISQNGDSIRLGSFFPILSWEGARGWATDPPTTSLAESSVSPTADFDVTIDVPEGLEVIATGRTRTDGRWVARDVRDFAVAVGRFDDATLTTYAGRRVKVLVGVAEGVDANPSRFVRAAARALNDLAPRYGRYPWRMFSMAIMPDLGAAGVEYPAMVFQGEDSLENATTHEVAHSWFYGLVGNNQARDPWLDEGVTSWAQARGDGILGYFRDLRLPEEVRGEMGRPMTYWDERTRDYYEGVYAQGVKALDALGDARAVDCALKRYVAANAYGVATTDDLLDALETEFPRAERVLRRFGARR